MTGNRPLILGIGNEFRQDDAAGLLVARALAADPPSGWDVIEHHGEGTGLMALWQGRSRLILVDAVSSGVLPGLLHDIPVHLQPLPAHFSAYSSHAFGLAQAIEMSRVMGDLPACVDVIGIEAAAFTQGGQMTPEVAQSIGKAIALIRLKTAS